MKNSTAVFFIAGVVSVCIRGIFAVQDMAFDFNRWFHLVLVFHGPNDGQGITVHLNNQSVRESIKPSSNFSPGNATGEVAIGRLYVDRNEHYSNVMADELTFWNRQLSETEVEVLRMKYEM